VLDLLFRLREEIGMTLLLVSYDASVGARADRTLTLSDGVLLDQGPLASSRGS
jgi:predicted ABC-type transport system involved in lysophospholipase L1 biosynthesis ATPase subunit